MCFAATRAAAAAFSASLASAAARAFSSASAAIRVGSPVVAVGLLRSAFHLTDAYWAGALGPAHLSAICVNAFAVWLIQLACSVVATGVQSRVSARVGAGDDADEQDFSGEASGSESESEEETLLPIEKKARKEDARRQREAEDAAAEQQAVADDPTFSHG